MASASESNRDRRERLRQLALETIDINKVGTARASHGGESTVMGSQDGLGWKEC